MVRKNSDLNIETKPASFGETGKITVRNLLNGPDEMYNKGRCICAYNSISGKPHRPSYA